MRTPTRRLKIKTETKLTPALRVRGGDEHTYYQYSSHFHRLDIFWLLKCHHTHHCVTSLEWSIVAHKSDSRPQLSLYSEKNYIMQNVKKNFKLFRARTCPEQSRRIKKFVNFATIIF